MHLLCELWCSLDLDVWCGLLNTFCFATLFSPNLEVFLGYLGLRMHLALFIYDTAQLVATRHTHARASTRARAYTQGTHQHDKTFLFPFVQFSIQKINDWMRDDQKDN